MNTTEDWHPAEVVAALRKIGTSMAELSRESGLNPSTLANTLNRGWPRGEWIIAQRLNLHPSQIWPSRYFDHAGNLKERKPRKSSQWAGGEPVKIFDNLLAVSAESSPCKPDNMIGEIMLKTGLQLLREECNFSPWAISEALDIPLSSIAQIERLGKDVKLSTLKRYVEAIGGKLSLRVELPNGDIRTLRV
ncbi:sugar fermentation stimulation protein B [Xenorhabdus stockiae]|uniref:Sugar fermentation stimulation protein B n=1 Tax=Xenorhabdus stockiae TaxID=351614 RepID=A0A2D0KAW9_9GAMM|nr:sugar fermentation stimulation protein B [Xenorhabdus stockiae]